MPAEVLNIKDLLVEDHLGLRISDYWIAWNNGRREAMALKDEVRRYVYATDTTQTTNSKLPWKNKTTLPKLCQIRDNLYSNYVASLFPKRKWLIWEANSQEAADVQKKDAITNYATWFISNPTFKTELSKCIMDYIDYGNAFATYEWRDDTVEVDEMGGRVQVGYVGPVIKRISPQDIVFNPIATDFYHSPKIVRSLVTLGDVKELLERQSGPDNREQFEQLFKYLTGIRKEVQGYSGDFADMNDTYKVDGFDSFSTYLAGDYCELLTFYGDIYDYERDELLKNYVVTVVDRHKIVYKQPNPSFFGMPNIFHVGWRVRQDNLWAMGPLENLVGMQYRIDHIENLKADVFDLIAFPVLKVRGLVEDFEWKPFEKIYVGDEGDVEILSPPFQVLQANMEIENLQAQMEEMAGAPKEAMGIRTPGEKTAYEVQRLENAAGRIFQAKITQFEEAFLEPLLNGMLECGRRNMTSDSIRVIDDEFNTTTFQTLTADDITGFGRIRPIAARHFAERADKVQNVSQFFQTSLGVDPEIKAHFSTVKLAELFEELLDLEDYHCVQPYVRLSEQAEAQKLQNAHNEQTAVEAATPAGLAQDDFTGPDIAAEEGPPF